jgi:hypothetical protein
MIGILLHHFFFDQWLHLLLFVTFDSLFSNIHELLVITHFLLLIYQFHSNK